MELRQLAYFDAVARLGGFTRAARQLHVAQSAVSAQIRALGRELGVTLLTRTTRTVRLTAAGETFLARARAALSELDQARIELSATLSGRVNVGATSVLGSYDLPSALAGFSVRHPAVAVSMRSALIAKLLDKLDEGAVDLVLGPVHDDLAPRFSARLLAREELVLALPPGHPPAEFADLAGEPFVCLSAESGLRSILDAAAAAAGFTPDVRFETHSPAGIRELVSAGLGVALLARSATTKDGPPIAVRPVRPAVAHPPIGLIHHRDRRLTAPVQALRRHLIQAAAGSSPAGRTATTAGPRA
jgi:LysR family transcriptional regulator, transcription activator of glutamate synthase operon